LRLSSLDAGAANPCTHGSTWYGVFQGPNKPKNFLSHLNVDSQASLEPSDRRGSSRRRTPLLVYLRFSRPHCLLTWPLACDCCMRPMTAILSPTKASRDTRNNPAAVDALNPPPPLPSLMISMDVGRHWSDFKPRPAAVTAGLHGLASTFDAVSDAKEVVGDQMLVLPDFDLQTHGAMSLSCTQYPISWNAPLLGAQSAFNSQHTGRIPDSYDLSPGSLSSERGDSVAMRLDYGRPTRSSSSASSSWVMSTGSESDSSVASDEEQDDMAAKLEDQISNVVNAPPRGPCSKTWSLPPVRRVSLQTKVIAV
jgi:hypothetical protein